MALALARHAKARGIRVEYFMLEFLLYDTEEDVPMWRCDFQEDVETKAEMEEREGIE
jgi:hypothetical protein